MAMRMEMQGAIAMGVDVKMHAIAPQPPEHMRAQTDQHEADGALDRVRESFRERLTEQDRDPGEGEQRQAVPEAPSEAVLDDIPHVGAPGGDAGDRGNMIGLKRVLHAQQKPKPRNCEHICPASYFPSLPAAKQSSNPMFAVT